MDDYSVKVVLSFDVRAEDKKAAEAIVLDTLKKSIPNISVDISEIKAK